VGTLGLRRGKKKKQTNAEIPAPLPDLNLPPPPALGNDLPPLPLPEIPPVTPLEVDGNIPVPQPLPDIAVQPLPTPDVQPINDEIQSEENYTGLWARKSDKPLQQIYGHIDRISSGETGSLLDRYADRFGQDLDRDIIVLRKAERENLVSKQRDAPVVELIQDEVETVEYGSRLEEVEAQLRALKPEYESAKASGDSETLERIMPELKSLMAERKSLKQSNEVIVAQEDTSEYDIFPEFVGIVDNLLERDLPAEVIEEFMNSEEFEIYRQAGEDPSAASSDLRTAFFQVVDEQLGNMPKDRIDAFAASEAFEIYKQVAALYN